VLDVDIIAVLDILVSVARLEFVTASCFAVGFDD